MTDDPRRALELLWGDPPPRTRGPAQGLTSSGIVAATIALADEIGLDALTMRRVADRLGVGVASLYTYVPGRSELLALVLDHCVGESPLPHTLPGGWREQTESWACADWTGYTAHPWQLDLALRTTTITGPRLMAWYDSALSVFDGTGLSPQETVAAVDAVDGFVRGHARTAIDAAAVATSGVGAVQDEIIGRHLRPGSLPTMLRMAAAGALGNSEHDFRFGLRCLLDGLSALVTSRT